MKNSNLAGAGILGLGCSTVLFIWAFAFAVGGFCFDYSLNYYFGKDIHWLGDVVCGGVASPLMLPSAIIAFVLNLCGYPAPFFGG